MQPYDLWFAEAPVRGEDIAGLAAVCRDAPVPVAVGFGVSFLSRRPQRRAQGTALMGLGLVFFGNPGDVPIAGDFDGDGCDTLSIYRPSNQTFYIINKLGSGDQGLGAADFSYVFGNPGDKPFVGDFNGNGIETAGLHRESTGFVYFRNTHTQGNADAQFYFGDPDDRLVAGDWTGDGTFTPALFRPSNTTMYFRYTNTQGNADNQFVPVPTNSAWLPVSGQTN